MSTHYPDHFHIRRPGNTAAVAFVREYAVQVALESGDEPANVVTPCYVPFAQCAVAQSYVAPMRQPVKV